MAVASNFAEPLKVLAQRFESKTGHKVLLSPGSSGKQTAQILSGAPFDIFFCADNLRTKELEAQGKTLPGGRFVYAQGRIALWSRDPGLEVRKEETLKQGNFSHLALANPKLAPYGAAAQQWMEKLGVWEKLQGKVVLGENISQAYQFIHSGSAELGFVALSQLQVPGKATEGVFWVVPLDQYEPIFQEVVLLRDNPGARAFLEFIKTKDSKNLIQSYGYLTP